jgi:dienelactone hydrolase
LGVRFRLLPILALLLLSGCATGSGVAFNAKQLNSSGASVTIRAELYRPAGDGPFPAVIVLHACNGVDPHQGMWARRLVDWGYVAIVPDSFGSRQVGSQCMGGTVSGGKRASDVHGAAAYLRGLPFVRGDRIGMIGFSHGGWTVMKAVQSDIMQNLDAPPLQAAVAYYPICSASEDVNLAVPTQVFIGELDDWTPADRCRAAKDYMTELKRPDLMTLTIYPGAYHGFDKAGAMQYVTGAGNIAHRLQYDGAANDDAAAKTHAFFDRLLKP